MSRRPVVAPDLPDSGRSPGGLALRLRGRVPVGLQAMRRKRSFRCRRCVVLCRRMRGRVIGLRGGRPGGGRRRVARPGRRMRLAVWPLDSRHLARVPRRPLGLDITGGQQSASRQDIACQGTRLQEERGEVEARQSTIGPDEGHGGFPIQAFIGGHGAIGKPIGHPMSMAQARRTGADNQTKDLPICETCWNFMNPSPTIFDAAPGQRLGGRL